MGVYPSLSPFYLYKYVEFIMVVTRSMSGTTKTADTNTKISVNHKAAKRPCKRAKSPRTEKVDVERNDYLKKYYENRPPPTYGITPFEVSCAGQLEWRGMSAKEKAPFLKLAREMRAEGRSFFSF
ncbi:uncharacterized protein LOC141711586 isoform X4 [Apium graveolens]|uniref:uncharacterized protein LOC141711586 isoform X4 n=1 Tax=Apium graveolens TaxID=4045 RepID=UPI003D7B967B